MKFKLPKLAGGRPGRWTLPAVLLGVYLFLKLQGWSYGFRAMGLERQMEQMRPALSAMALAEQLESTRKAHARLGDEVRRMDLQGARFLQRLSEAVPASVTVERMEVNPEGIAIQGILRPGMHAPEAVLDLWDRRMGDGWRQVRVEGLAPDSGPAGAWRFRLKARRGLDG